MLVCTSCGGGLTADSVRQQLMCRICGETYKIINNVPCFVSTDLEDFSEVPPEERESFLAMKRVAYTGGSLVSRMYRHYHRFAAKKRSEQGEKRVTLDVGFGIGEHYPFLTERERAEATFIGIDVDRFKLEHFSAAHPEIPVLQASAFSLPFSANSMDVVQQLATLEHFSTDDINVLLDEAMRVLKPGGVLVVCYPSEGGMLLGFCQRIMHAYLKARTGFDLDRGTIHRHVTGAEEIRGLLGGRRDLERLESLFYPFGVRSIGLSLFVNELYRKR